MSAVTSIASYFGSNRSLAHAVGAALEGCSHVSIPFSGSIPEVPHISARTINCNDANSAIGNLCKVQADPILALQLYRALRRLPFHPNVLAEAQRRCEAQNHV